MGYRSCFDEIYDVAVYDAGYAGLAAAWKLRASGKRVLLFSPRLSIAWESSLALASKAGRLEDELWLHFLGELEQRGLSRSGQINCAGAEIAASARLLNDKGMSVLLEARPVGIRTSWNQLTGVDVATKSGLRLLRARQWVDASDQGTLIGLFGNDQPGRKPDGWEQRAWLANANLNHSEELDSNLLPEDVTLEPALPAHQFLLCLHSREPMSRQALMERMLMARGSLGGVAARSSIICLAFSSLPCFSQAPERHVLAVSNQANLYYASPAYASSKVKDLSDRFFLGLMAAERLLHLPAKEETPATALDTESRRTLPVTERSCDILIAGAGTGGAIAALAALREGTDVVIIDKTTSAGGIGTGGMICGYFHGHSGGLYEESDRLARDLEKELLPGFKSENTIRWNHEAKRLAFEQLMGDYIKDFHRETMIYEVAMRNGRIEKVLAAGPDGLLVVRPKAVIDGTGDGDLAALAGASYDYGRPGDGFPLSYTQSSLRIRYQGSHAIAASNNYDAGWVDATDPEDLTRARLSGVAQYLRDHYAEEEHLVALAPVLGLRQSRHLHTEQRLTLDDIISHRRWNHEIGQVRSPLDTHSVDFEFEDDETLFWLWGCKHFRGECHAGIPYGLLIPKGFKNLWLACRAAGMTTAAAYAIRMQRDMQRMGEAAALAAVASIRDGRDAMEVAEGPWKTQLQDSGAMDECQSHDTWQDDPVGQLDQGIPGGYLWTLYRDKTTYEPAVVERMQHENDHVSWLAALLLAMWGDNRAEARFIQAIKRREPGLPTPPAARGAHGQWIDVPNWFLAVSTLRMCGSPQCLPVLLTLAAQPHNILDLRASIALTLERLATKISPADKATVESILQALVADDVPDRIVRPSRSLYRSLRGEEQQIKHDPRISNEEDNQWRLALTVKRAADAIGLACPVDVTPWLEDERALVRKAFTA